MSADWLNYTFRERRNFPRRYVTVHRYDDLWQTNVVEMRPYMRFNRGYHYILTVIDVLSKHAEPLKVKSGNKVTAKIIRDDIRKICILIEERNFTIRMWTETLEETQYQPLFYVFRNKGVGRFNCTLKTTWKQFTHNGNYKWIDILASTCRVSYQITTCASIELLICISHRCYPLDRQQTFNHGLQS